MTNTTYSRGFTIVEILVVVVVIAILASVAVLSYGGVVTRSKASKQASDLSNYQKVLTLEYTDTSNYPSATEIKQKLGSGGMAATLIANESDDSSCFTNAMSKDKYCYTVWCSVDFGCSATQLIYWDYAEQVWTAYDIQFGGETNSKRRFTWFGANEYPHA